MLFRTCRENDTPDQIPDKWLESYSIRDRDALFYNLPDRPTSTPTHHAKGREKRIVERESGVIRPLSVKN